MNTRHATGREFVTGGPTDGSRLLLARGAWMLAALASAPFTASGQGASAGAQDVGVLEEVVITAQRRAEKLQDVPISVAAYTQEQMDIQGVRAVDDIAAITPGISFGRGTFGSSLGSGVSIRGVSSGAGAATTGIYIDETPVQVRATIASGNFASNAYPQLFDVERVEVLRGPQGTLFGAGTEGGALRFITPQPSLTDRSVYARTEYSYTAHGAPSHDVGIALGGPLVADRLGVRLSVSDRRDGGYIDRLNYETGQVVEKNTNHTDSLIARLALTFAATEHLRFTPSVLHQRIDANDSNVIWLPGTEAGFVQPYTDWDEQRFEQGQRVRQYGMQNLTLSALKIDWDIGPVSVISNTSYYDRTERSVTDFTTFEVPLWTAIFTGTAVTVPGDPNWIAPGSDRQKNEYFTQEVRVQSADPDARLKWVAGAYYTDQDIFTGRRVENTFLPQILSDITGGFCQPDCYSFFFGVPAVDGKYIFIGETSTSDRQLAGFGQVDFDITSNLTATVGLRYARMEFDFANVADGPVNGPPAPRTDLGHNEESAVTPRFGLSYKTDSGNHFYVTAAKGFRPGGANAPLRNLACVPDLAEIGLSEVPLTYDSDSLWSYEVGTKLALVDNRLRLNASGFQIDWTDIINNVSLDCILSFTTNLGKARSRGWDIDVQYQPIESLLLSIALGDTNAEYTQSVYGVNPDGSPNTDVTLVTKGDALMGSSFRAYTSAQYSFKGVGGEPAYVRADYSHQGQNDRSASENTGNVGVDEVWRDPSIDNLDLRLGQKFGGWELSLFVKNALNDTPVIGKGRTFTGGSVQGSSHLFTGFTTRPRTFGLSAMYRR